MSRLQSLYLYGDEATSEKDYLVERKRIIDDIARIDARLEELEKDRSSQLSMSDREFMDESDHFIMEYSLLDKREIDYAKMAHEIAPRILKDFVASVVRNFCIKDGKIESISFENGIEVRFLHKGEDT